jgi:hypothetical protein
MGQKRVLQVIFRGKRVYSTSLKPLVCYFIFHAVCYVSTIRPGFKFILLSIQLSNFAQKTSLCNNSTSYTSQISNILFPGYMWSNITSSTTHEIFRYKNQKLYAWVWCMKKDWIDKEELLVYFNFYVMFNFSVGFYWYIISQSCVLIFKD